MEGIIRVSSRELKVLIRVNRGRNLEVSRHALVISHFANGCSWREVRSIPFASDDLLARWLGEFVQGALT